MATRAPKPPRGEKPADTIAYQRRQIDTLAQRIEELVFNRGQDGARIAELERQLRASGAAQNELRERLSAKKHELVEQITEVARLNGYIQRVQEVERPVHTITPGEAPDIASLLRDRRHLG